MKDGGRIRLRDVRDGVLLADLPGASEEEANRVCVAAGERLRGRGIGGLRDAVPAASSLLIVFDPGRVSRERIAAAIDSSRAAESAPGSRRTLRVPVAYCGPDLVELARAAGLAPEELALRHGRAEYRVAFLGFAPGFAYLTGLERELFAPRLKTPRTRVPAGSLAIGGHYTGIYPEESPGGWRLVGQTRIRLLDPDAEKPALLRAGDRVRFEPVRLEDLPRLPPPRRAALGGEPVLRVLAPGLATTVQGGPAEGLRASGIPAGGAIDPVSLARANARVGNRADAPGLEMALAGAELEALADCVVASEGEIEAEWNGRTPAAPADAAAFTMSAGDRLRLGRVRRGVWAYLAVRGGLEPLARFAPQPRLSAGDTLALGAGLPGRSIPAASSTESAPARESELRLRVLPGPEADGFDASELARFHESPWRVTSESNRRGLRLEGAAPLAHREASEIPPSGTVPGSIQVPGDGLPIVLGPDGPVTGGYPRIATVIGADLALLGRAAPGTVLRFAPVTLEEALEARRTAAVGVP